MGDDGVVAVDELTVALPASALPVPGARVLPVDAHAWSGKRTFDVVLSALMLLVALPVFVVVAVAIKLTSPGPVFFRQRRVGKGGAGFPMLKFRTMRANAEDQLRSDPALHALFLLGGHKIPSRVDPRVTAVGRILRRLSLDELPQLLNVLSGHMSMVGPRPVERSQLLRDYGEHEWAYLAVRPGLTGLWQVSGRSTVQFPKRGELDTRYVQGCGPWMDAKILVRTPFAVVTGLGAE